MSRRSVVQRVVRFSESPLLEVLFSRTNDVRTSGMIVTMSVTMSVTLTNVSVYCTASKITLLQFRITSADPPGVIVLL